MNDLISKTEVNGCDVGKINESISNHMTDNVKTIVTFPSSTKMIRSGHMKMLGHGVIASSNLFLLDSSYLVDIDSELLMTGTIISIPGKHANYWTIHWDNDSLKTKIKKTNLFRHK